MSTDTPTNHDTYQVLIDALANRHAVVIGDDRHVGPRTLLRATGLDANGNAGTVLLLDIVEACAREVAEHGLAAWAETTEDTRQDYATGLASRYTPVYYSDALAMLAEDLGWEDAVFYAPHPADSIGERALAIIWSVAEAAALRVLDELHELAVEATEGGFCLACNDRHEGSTTPDGYVDCDDCANPATWTTELGGMSFHFCDDCGED